MLTTIHETILFNMQAFSRVVYGIEQIMSLMPALVGGLANDLDHLVGEGPRSG